MIDFTHDVPDVVRFGVGYDVIRDHLKRFWDLDLPEDPGKAALPSGHRKVLPPLESLERLIESRKATVA